MGRSKTQILSFRNNYSKLALKSYTVKPVYSGHLRFLKKVSAITRCPLNRGLSVIFTESKFCEFRVFWTIQRRLDPKEIIAKLSVREIREIYFLAHN